MPPARPLAERFWEKVERGEGCYLWTASTDHAGYGQIKLGQTMVRAHRVAWELMYGPIPPGLSVLHRCDVRRCVRADDHLFLGTIAENNADMDAKGRASRRGVRGERHHQAKLTRSQVEQIRALFPECPNLSALGRRFGVSHNTVARIVNGTGWRLDE